MQVEAIYNRGTLEFVHPMTLKHDHLRLVVEVPDDEIVTHSTNPLNLAPDVLAKAKAMLEKYAAILNAPLPRDDELSELSSEYQERLEAIAIRAQIRQEQGRPV